MTMSRRELMKLSLAGGVALGLPVQRAFAGEDNLSDRLPDSALPQPYTVPFRRVPALRPVQSDATTDYYRLAMHPVVAEVIAGYRTPMWGYNGLVPGPTIRQRRGRASVVRCVNQLPAEHPTLDYVPWTSLHLHGSASLPQYDGYASDITMPGQWKDYRYPNTQQARTLWYHDHGVHHTAQNVYMGLAGQYHLLDRRERRLPIPKGWYDVALTVGDMMFKQDGSLLFHTDGEDGFYGDVIAVNGRAWPAMRVARRRYRFRILNASVSRAYAWYLSDGTPLQVIGTDGGLMPAPATVDRLPHAPGERYEVVIDFSRYPPGARVELRNKHPRNTTRYRHTDKVMAFDVTDAPFRRRHDQVPSRLRPRTPAMTWREDDSVATRAFDFGRQGGEWAINETTWRDVVDSGFTAVLASPLTDTFEVWELNNLHGGWHHPAHIHFVDLRILSRNGGPPHPHERGAKDVVFLGENESVRVLVGFEGGHGRYMMHCHDLVHEDHDMMAQFEILDPAGDAYDPFDDPPRHDPEDEW
ncbi:multicopper oxidase domain-containing protein [Nocardioidaceae bacterium]|nr:multicopper oxidase domain-containing protein [Nocardioidaceae bacterium]